MSVQVGTTSPRSGKILGFSPQKIGTLERLALGPREIARLNALVVGLMVEDGLVETYSQPADVAKARTTKRGLPPVAWAKLTAAGWAAWRRVEPRLEK